MNTKQSHMNFTDGTSQADRFPTALEDGYIKADEMRFEDLLSLGVDYAGLLNFFDLDNHSERSWATFFSSDVLVIFARVLATHLKKIDSEFHDEFLKRFDLSDVNLHEVPNYQLAIRIDYWFTSLKTIESEAGEKLYLTIKTIIEDKLKMQLMALEHFLGQDFVKNDFDRIWYVKPPDDRPPGNDDIPPDNNQPEDDDFLKSNFAAFYNAVLLIQTASRKLLPDALESQTHNPAIGMYVAFLKLYQQVQHRLNRFTAKHLDFYYRDVLKIQPRQIIHDRAYLKFDTDVADREVLIAAGTEFIAGTDENNRDIIYTADNDLLVHSAGVESLYTLFFERDPLASPENDLGFITEAKINRIPVTMESGSVDAKETRAWPIFGAPRNASQKRSFENAPLGFAIASPILFLKEGQRDINVAFKIGSAFPGVFQNISGFISEVIQIIRSSEELEDIELNDSNQEALKADIFFKIFRRMFTIQLTAENGWYEVEDYLPLNRVVDDKYEEDCLSIQIQLTPKDQSIVPYSSDIHGAGYDTDQPMIRFLINPMASLFPYSLLKNIVIREIEIDVNVSGVKDLVIHNDLGQVDPGSPFTPFGPLPEIGSYLIIGNQEAAVKQLTRFDVMIEWAGLPSEKGGFKDYYQAYESDYNYDVFKIGLSVLNGGKWQPTADEDQPRLKMFGRGVSRLEKSICWPCHGVVRLFRPLEEKITPAEFSYDSSRKDGFFKFTLVAPPYAFGHRDYPLKLARVLSENAKLKKAHLHKPVPNPPYTPRIDSISVNYSANVRVNLEKIGSSDEARRGGGLYHIHPLGVERLSPQTHAAITMVPRYNSDGNLFIGLTPRNLSGILTLFFNLQDDSTLESDADPPAVHWDILSSNRWQRLKKNHILSDTTNGFLTSGIVTLLIPTHESGANSTMPGDIFWLRASLERHPEVPCSLNSIQTQVLEVTWQKQNASSSHMDLKLPAGTIKNARVSIPGINRIAQLTDSFGGRLPEGENHLKTRISERLRHKNRASVPWDYERLILNRFPGIYKVKCFSNMVDDPRNWEQPGDVLVVVIPFLKDTLATTMKPTVNGMQLREIEEYIKGLSSPFVRIKVRNPAYEKIQVRCKVQFSPGKAGGYYLRQLNQALVDYLSPWNETGYTAQFGWRIRRYDLKSYIRSLDYINFVTDFSLLRVAEDDSGYYSLFDTVARQVKDISPHYPWSIAIPFKQHYLEISEKAEVVKPVVTGINELEIGSNFIIPGKQSHASEK
jgi:hypothetical protein